MLKNGHPDHVVSADSLSASCTCSWSVGARNRAEAEYAAACHHFKHAPRLAVGEFLATCRMSEHVPFNDVPHELLDFIDAGEISERDLPDALRSYANGTGTTRVTTTWDSKRMANVVALTCSFTTTDKAEFEAHMAAVHGRARSNWEASTLTANGRHCRSIKAGPAKVKRPEAGQPFKPSLKAIAQDLVTCGHCGLVIERTDHSGERFAREHLAECAAASAGAA